MSIILYHLLYDEVLIEHTLWNENDGYIWVENQAGFEYKLPYRYVDKYLVQIAVLE